jgi:hypothetical protein
MDKTKFGGYNITDFVTVREDGSLDTSIGASGMGLQDLYDIAGPENQESISDWIDRYTETWEG